MIFSPYVVYVFNTYISYTIVRSPYCRSCVRILDTAVTSTHKPQTQGTCIVRHDDEAQIEILVLSVDQSE